MKTLIETKSEVHDYHNILANCHSDVATVYPSKQCCKQDTCQCPVSVYSSFHDPPTEHSIQRYIFFLFALARYETLLNMEMGSRCTTDPKAVFLCLYDACTIAAITHTAL